MGDPLVPDEVGCGWCGARAGEGCRTQRGRPRRWHSIRVADAAVGASGVPADNVVDFEAAKRRRLARAHGYTG